MRLPAFILLLIFLTFLTENPAISKSQDYLYNRGLDNSTLSDYLDTAILFKDSAEYDKAKTILKKAAGVSQDRRVLYYLGKLEFLSGNSKKAIDILKNIKDKDWLIFLYLGLAYEDLIKENLAITHYLKSIKLKENNIALFRLGKIYRKRGRYSEAIEVFLKVIKLDSSLRLAHYYLGDCLYKQSKYSRAYDFLFKSINFYPRSKTVNKRLEIVKKRLGKDFFVDKKEKKYKKRKKVKLSFYEPQEPVSLVRVALGRGLEEFSFSCGGIFTVSDGREKFRGQANKFYSLIYKKGRVILKDYDTKKIYGSFSSPVKILSPEFSDQRYPFYVLDVTYGERDFWHKKIDRIYRGSLEAVEKNKHLNLINVLDAEEYLYGVLSAEISANSDPEALRAQAVAARTLISRNMRRHRKEGFNFCADVHCQVYQGLSAETLSTNKAVFDTKGQILVSADKPIEAFYHANCGGCLAADAFGDNDYLDSKIDSPRCPYPASPYQEELWFLDAPRTFCFSETKASFRWQRVYDKEDFSIAFGFHISDLKHIIAREKGDCFHNKSIDVITSREKIALKGGLKIRHYFDRLRSSAFKIERKLSQKGTPEMLFLWGAGFGHGAGLCQDGASAMAEKGYTYKKILKHYYPGAKIKKIY
ncbi:MAG: SpoIID/LytB domain-containing protein [Omnitrophica bacterium]|nr:SpoIID/LytB domain-containing protein [Candidatus Omnitrophota bacterium]